MIMYNMRKLSLKYYNYLQLYTINPIAPRHYHSDRLTRQADFTIKEIIQVKHSAKCLSKFYKTLCTKLTAVSHKGDTALRNLEEYNTLKTLNLSCMYRNKP